MSVYYTTGPNFHPTHLAPVTLKTTTADFLLQWRDVAAFQIQEDHLGGRHGWVNDHSCMTEHIKKSVASAETHWRDLHKTLRTQEISFLVPGRAIYQSTPFLGCYHCEIHIKYEQLQVPVLPHLVQQSAMSVDAYWCCRGMRYRKTLAQKYSF